MKTNLKQRRTPKPHLKDHLLLNFKLPEGRAQQEVFDGQQPGLVCVIGARRKTFCVVRRVDGKKVRFPVGIYSPPSFTLSMARAKARAILAKLDAGIDPREEEKLAIDEAALAAQNTFHHVSQRFLKEYAQGKKKPLRAKSVDNYRRVFADPAVASWQTRPINTISKRDAIKVIEHHEGRGHFAMARQMKANLSMLFSWARAKELVANNPVQDAPLNSEPSDFTRDRVLSVTELKTIITALKGVDNPARAYAMTLLLCGQRRNETSLMKWSDLTLDGDLPVWKIPKQNTKNNRAHDVPLSPQMVMILKEVKNIGEYVFSFGGPAMGPAAFSRLKLKLDGKLKDAKLAHWTWHDLRHSLASGMGDLGFAPHVIEAVLNHRSGTKKGMAGLYNKSTYDKERREALAKWAKTLLS